MKRLILIFLLSLFFIPSSTQKQEPKQVHKKTEEVKKVNSKEKKEFEDTTKIDFIFIQQKALIIEMDSSLLKIKEQNIEMEEMLKENDI